MNAPNIEDQLQHFYPKGVSKDSSEYWASDECKNYEALVVKTVHEPSDSYNDWKNFLIHLSNTIQIPISDYTDGQIPSFFAHLPESPSKQRLELPGLTEEICIYKSFLSNVFTVVGIRNVQWTNSMGYSTITNLEAFISPSEYTSDLFNTIFESVNTYSQGFEFISYDRGQKLLKNLNLPFSDKNPCTLFDAIFAPFDFSGYELIGNIEYETK